MKILITGADGFIAQNFIAHLQETKNIEFISFTRKSDLELLPKLLIDADWVFHLAGANRPAVETQFKIDNVNFTQKLCNAIRDADKRIKIAFSSSIQAENDGAYGKSKLEAEKLILALNKELNIPVFIYRLPNVFGKWSRPNYNSVVSTFCFNVMRGKAIEIHNPNSKLNLVYIDDVIKSFFNLIEHHEQYSQYIEISPHYETHVGELAKLIKSFKCTKNQTISHPVGTGFSRALYSTYMSFLPKEHFSQHLEHHRDVRGKFAEIFKTADFGQVSFFTAKPGITRGGHYHHTKSEKFVVVRGKAQFRFKNVLTNETHDIFASERELKIINTIPGWAHDITNIGNEDLICILWANELFDLENQDTSVFPLQ